jgi:diguanylate cyclase (GGDEF)-like protein
MISRRWKEAVEQIEYAFQPIVNIHTGVCFAVEALMRNWEAAGFSSIQDFFDIAYREQTLYGVDLLLRRKCFEQYLQIPDALNYKLFYNLDNRLVHMPDYVTGNTAKILQGLNIPASSLCLEVSERHQWEYHSDTKSILNLYKQQTYRIALDDFGSGYSGLQLLYHSEPNYIKIDRFFISDVCTDARKKLFVSSIVRLAHTLGIQVVAEGVEYKSEYYACREIGCDYIQGFYICKPTQEKETILNCYEIVQQLNQRDQRRITSDTQLIRDQIRWIHPVRYPGHELTQLFELFRKYNKENFIPVLNENEEPIGIIHERELKEYVYSPYGKELLKNRRLKKSLYDFISSAPSAEISSSLEEILEIYSFHQTSDCLLITENGKYKGLLTARTLLKALNEKNIAMARDLNPLSKLPGNQVIAEYISNALQTVNPEFSTFVYFDFDNFKPFNDVYGFRTGDRVIHVFADILKCIQMTSDIFIGHIGGDDFFMASQTVPFEIILAETQQAQKKFVETTHSMYTEEHQQAGHIHTKDRMGFETDFDLLSVSAAVMRIKHPEELKIEERFSEVLAKAKKRAKESEDHLAQIEI